MRLLHTIKKFVPKRLFAILQPFYHRFLSFFGALLYRFPSKKICVIGVTGTKGKSSVTEITNAILEAGGMKTGMVNGIRFKVGNRSFSNKLKMTMPGRFFIQKYLREAVRAKCDVFILEMTSEGTKQFRHKHIALDGLIFTNLSPEHIEAHGSYENYRNAKLEIARALERSMKKHRVMVANADDAESEKFLAINVEKKLPYSLEDAKIYRILEDGIELTFKGTQIRSNLRGKMNISNILAGATLAEHFGVDAKAVREALKNIVIPGRLEYIRLGQNFDVVLDYAHTADSLRQLFEAFPHQRKICVLGATGGGRDRAKRKAMGAISDRYCDRSILTNEDPYDEDPKRIVGDLASGFKKHTPDIIMNRREAIGRALALAGKGDVVLIAGKGTDPYIMVKDGKKIPWSDAKVTRKELEKFLSNSKKNS